MDSILYRIYESWFSPPDQTAHRAVVLKNRMRESMSAYSSLMEELEESQQKKWRTVLENQMNRHLDELPEMFALGFSLGAQLMIEVLSEA